MRARRGLIPSSFLVLLFSLILVSCSGESDAPPPIPPPVPAGLLWAHHTYDPTAGNRYRIVRSQADGSNVIILADEPTVTNDVPRLAGSSVVYMTQDGQIGGPGPRDIWTVQTNGTDKHVLAQTAEDEIIRDVIGRWVLYDVVPTTSLASVTLDGAMRQVLAVTDTTGGGIAQPSYERQVSGRATFQRDGNLFSVLPDGTDLHQLTAIPRGPNGEFPLGGSRGVVGAKVIYSVLDLSSPRGIPDLFAVPVTGGPVVTLAAGPEYELLGAVVGERVVYSRCGLNFDLAFDQCDVSSVLSDGQGRVALTATRDINYVQGAIGEQVIIRRSQRGGTTDSLFSIPVSGGAETPLLTLSAQNEFVSGIVGDRILVIRTTGLWSLKADGSGLVQLTSDPSDWFSGSTGPFACFARGPSQPDLWCVPADGSGLATQVATGAYFVSGL